MENMDTFIMIKLQKFGLCALVRVAFLVGVSMDDRMKYFNDIKRYIFGNDQPVSLAQNDTSSNSSTSSQSNRRVSFLKQS
jgi:hypothetical protein